MNLDKPLDDLLRGVRLIVIATGTLELDDDNRACGILFFPNTDGGVIEESADVRLLARSVFKALYGFQLLV